MTLAVEVLYLPELFLMMMVPGSMMLILVSLEDHGVTGTYLQINQYIFYNMQVDLVDA